MSSYVDSILADVEDYRTRCAQLRWDNDHLRTRLAEVGMELAEKNGELRRLRRTEVTVSDNPNNFVGREAASWPPAEYALQFRQMMEESDDL